jgi:hypothetical protein
VPAEQYLIDYRAVHGEYPEWYYEQQADCWCCAYGCSDHQGNLLPNACDCCTGQCDCPCHQKQLEPSRVEAAPRDRDPGQE